MKPVVPLIAIALALAGVATFYLCSAQKVGVATRSLVDLSVAGIAEAAKQFEGMDYILHYDGKAGTCSVGSNAGPQESVSVNEATLLADPTIQLPGAKKIVIIYKATALPQREKEKEFRQRLSSAFAEADITVFYVATSETNGKSLLDP